MQNYECEIFHQITEIQSYTDEKKFRIAIQVPMKIGWIERMKFFTVKGGEKSAYQMRHIKNENDYVYFETEVFLKNSALYHYYFSFEANRIFRYFKRINITESSSITAEECFKMSVGFGVPYWAQGQIMYHIFVDRFRKGREKQLPIMPNRKIHKNWYESPDIGPDKDQRWNIDFYGGDLLGIENSLDYIKSLGVSIIYLSPIVRSQSNHRYDTADYENVDPYVGTNESLKSLCEAAHKKNMYIVLDAVFNHTGNDSKYFNQYGTFSELGAFQSEDSPYSEFYKKHYSKKGKLEFYYWWGVKSLPKCDGTSEKWKNYILGKGGIIDKWFALGIDGLRLDVADELTDEFIEGIRVAVKRNKEDGFILGEVWKNPMRMDRTYIESGKAMDTVMNYFLVDGLIRYFKYADVSKLKRVLQEILTDYPDETIYSLMNFTSTHDISRAIEIFGCDEFKLDGEWGWNLVDESLEFVKEHHITKEEYKYGKKIFKAYIFTLMFLPGTVSIFYGDEVGLCGIGNLANRAPYPWKSRDKDLLTFFRNIGKIRNKEQFLRLAELKVVQIDENKFVFERKSEHENILVIVSRVDNSFLFDIPKEYQTSECLYELNCKYNNDKVAFKPYGAIALKK